ncbi:hypothetical protein DFP73DRAFT_527773 [Morchella snyderi]|nr:hypothetical protein DFP73DRAFT_527773 [Morchella snyderi]
MKLSALLLLLTTLCLLHAVSASTTHHPHPRTSLSKRTPAKDKAPNTRSTSRSKSAKGPPASKARRQPCASMDTLLATDYGPYLCAGNGIPNSARGDRRPETARFDRAAIEAALAEVERGGTFRSAKKEYPDSFSNTYSKAVAGARTREAGVMFPEAASKGGKGVGAASTGDDLMEFPIFVPGYMDGQQQVQVCWNHRTFEPQRRRSQVSAGALALAQLSEKEQPQLAWATRAISQATSIVDNDAVNEQMNTCSQHNQLARHSTTGRLQKKPPPLSTELSVCVFINVASATGTNGRYMHQR